MGAADDAIAFARAQLGKPYRFGATGPDAYDCSGLIYAAYRAGGVTLGRTTYQQIFDGHNVSQQSLLAGDLVFPDAGHVMLYTGGGMVIEAPHSGAVVVERKMWGFWQGRRVADPASGSPTATDTIGLATVVASFNPLNPATWPVVGQVDSIATHLIDPDFWKRAGIMVIGVVLIIAGLVFLRAEQLTNAVKAGIDGTQPV